MKKLSVSNRSCIVLGLVLLLCSITKLHAQNKHYRVVIEGDQTKSFLQTKDLEVDHFHFENGKITAEISHKDLQLLRKKGIKHKIKIRNLEKRIPRINKRIDKKNAGRAEKNAAMQVPTPSNFSLGSMGGFHTHDEAIAVLDKMRQLYPQLITVKSSIGTSIEGRPIYMVKISDNADTDEDEEEMLFTSLHHAREPIGLSQNLFYMWYLLENYATNDEVKTLIDNSELYFIPIINPDGYLYNQQTNPNGGGFWRKNRRNNGSTYGVDLNRNYGYEWGAHNGSSNNPSSEVYQGTTPFSEPETQAMRDFVNQHNFTSALNYHSYSDLLLHPWGYSSTTLPPDKDTFVAMGNYMTEENSYAVGTPYQTLGVTGGGSSDDWMYGEQTSKAKIYAMTPEVGGSNDGFWPPSSRIIPLCNESYYLNSKIMRMGIKYAKLTPANTSQTITELTGTVGFSLKRFSVNDANWTVSLSSTSSNVSSFGQAVSYNNLVLLGTQNGTIDFTLKADTPTGTQIPITITVNNGSWQYTQEVTITYNGSGTTCNATVPGGVSSSGVGTSGATVSWNAVSGTTYDLRYRQTGTTNWTTVAVNQTSYAITGLSATTGYEAQVRSKCPDNSTSNYSTSVNFTTTSISTCNATVPGGVSSSGVGTSGATVSWNAVSGTTYDLRYRQTGTTNWTTAAVNQNSYAITSLSAATAYEAQVRSKCPDGTTSNYSASVNFTTTSSQVNYCTSSGTNASEEYIGNVQLGTINNASSASSGYTDHTSISTDLSKGVSNTITITPTWTGSTYSEGYSVWIDYNQNGDFEDPGEQVWTQTATRNTPVSGAFTVPASATEGATRMRVSMSYNAIPNPCGTFNYGEVEDYTVTIKAGGGENDICEGVAAYNASQTYQVGDRVTYQGNLYERTQSGWTNLGACGSSAISKDGDVSVVLSDTYILHPNPVGKQLNIQLNVLKEVSYTVTDALGKVALKGKCTSHVDVDDLKSGVYVLTIFNEGKGHSARFVKK
ncbi:M14 family zinc carboxypeptidase [Aquimarina sp. 2201CG1-2-11]|uniref:M14 family zinc carboxypeptidase n=1 Tax=Aquimarina discodermiae TaxID=3231043 RepID=UPI003462D655